MPTGSAICWPSRGPPTKVCSNSLSLFLFLDGLGLCLISSAGLANQLSALKATCEVLQRDKGALEGENGRLQAEVGRLQTELGRIDGLVGAVAGDLLVAAPEGQGGAAALTPRIVPRVAELERDAMRAGVKAAFAVSRSHYGESYDWDVLQGGYAAGCEEAQLEEIEEAATDRARTLADLFAPYLLPPRGPAPPQ
jgi:hypothetical protein